MAGKTLLFICDKYPQEGGDTSFIQNEIEYLSRQFSKIIVISHGNPEKELVKTQDNVIVFFAEKNKSKEPLKKMLNVFFLFFKIDLYREILLLLKNHKLCLNKIYIMFRFLYHSSIDRRLIRKISTKENIHLCYTFWFNTITYSALKSLSCPVITRTHRIDLYEFCEKYNYQPFKEQMDKKITNIFFISKQGLDYYKKTYNISNESKYCLSYLGTRKLYNSNICMDLEAVVQNNYVKLVSCSYIVEVKKINLIIDSLAEINDIKIDWFHVGNGPLMNDIQSYAKQKLQDKKNINFNFLGYQSSHEIQTIYENTFFDLFINSSYSEGLPVSMMEACSYGIPVAGTDVGGVSEIVDEHNGFLINRDNFVNEFNTVLHDYVKLSVNEKLLLRKNAFDKWNILFNADNNYKQFAEMLINIVNEK